MTESTSTLPEPAPIPMTGYTAYFVNYEGDLFSLPVIALAPYYELYVEGGTPTLEWEPAVMNAAGSIIGLHSGSTEHLIDGFFVGVTPAGKTIGDAEAFLDSQYVVHPDKQYVPGEPREWIGRVAAARIRLSKQVVPA
jgi:hypothetical protein